MIAQKLVGKQNIEKAIQTAIGIADAAVSEGRPFCVGSVDVGLDTTAIREAVCKVMQEKVSDIFYPDYL